MKIIAIDPGNINSAYVIMDCEYRIYDKGLLPNEELLKILKTGKV